MTDFEQRVTNLFYQLKNGDADDGAVSIPDIEPRFRLVPVTAQTIEDPHSIALMTEWRERFQHNFPSQFLVSEARTTHWAWEMLHKRADRILFFIEDGSGEKIGHMGLSSFDFARGSCEFDNVIRGRDDAPKGIMSAATLALTRWTLQNLAPDDLCIQTDNENTRALALYYCCGFRPFELTLMTQVRTGEGTAWVGAKPRDPVGRIAVHMRHQDCPLARSLTESQDAMLAARELAGR